MRTLIRRVWQSFRAPADAADWLEALVVSLVAVAIITAIAFAAGMVHWRPNFDGWQARVIAIVAGPAMLEEWVFRGLLIPGRGESRHPLGWFLIGITAFVLWHIVEATTFLPRAHLFLTAPFLVCATVLGIACSIMRYRTRSILPGILLHGGVVLAWQMLLGGPAIKDLF
jgi:predicted Abi (CAAX) family protease